MKIKPLFDRVVVEEEQSNTTQTGIFIGNSNQDKPKFGKIIYAGDGNENADGKKSTMYVNIGDRIIYSKFAGEDIVIDKKTYSIIRQTDILAIIE